MIWQIFHAIARGDFLFYWLIQGSLQRNQMKIICWDIHRNGKDYLYQWKFLSFGLKNALEEFQRMMDRVCVGSNFTRCYIDDNIVFSSTMEEHGHYLQDVFEHLRVHGFKLHPQKM